MLSRVVLPSDELVRVTCAESDARVRNLLNNISSAEDNDKGDPLLPVGTGHKKKNRRKKMDKELGGDRTMQQVFPLGASASPSATKLSNAPLEAPVWDLVLVRTGQVLDPDAVVCDALQDLDILDCRPQPTPQTSTRSTKQSEPSVSRALRTTSSSQARTVLEPGLCKANAYHARRMLANRRLLRTVRCKQKLKIAAGDNRKGGQWWFQHCCSTVCSSSSTPPMTQGSPSSSVEPAILLRGGMQLLDQLSALETEVSSLLLFVRDSNSSSRGGTGGSASSKIKIEELLPPLLRVFRTLFQHRQQHARQQLLTMTKFPITEGDYTQDLSRALKDATTESLLPGVPVLMQGWVVCAEWGAFWRNTRRDYACLCDDGMLSFFASERQCSEYLFALTRARNGHCGPPTTASQSSSPSESGSIKKSPLKVTIVPQSQIDLADTTGGWSVRKGDTGEASDRHVFALFDNREQKSKLQQLRLIVDVDSDDDANKWVTAISAELKQSEALTNLKSYCEAFFQSRSSNESTTEAPQCPATATAAAQSFALPLRWLHAQMERVNGRCARHQRLRCVNLSQALKDFRRDRIQINGLLYPSACVNEMLIALTTKILSTLTNTAATTQKQRHTVTSKEASSPLEMIAMRLAKELLVCSSRTDGGGDILDALHLVFPSSSFSICPRPNEITPVSVSLSSTELSSPPSLSCCGSDSESATPTAEITITMRYWVIPSGSMAHDEQHQRSAGDEVPIKKKNGDNGGDLDKLEVVGTYFKRLVGDFYNWHEVEGHVKIKFLR